ncbi:hypothetical protein PILCRDRAFT_821700 [Piloderma croceum F 1598]|uniref:Uncharacterized protein n=1 Tax=Piloderma croceum (strain F 1598) TaxID=765440 RepID=A0A0C3F9C7_PILCF|nr:hypothetical protein PILCRDRAFT_821700 [Piloderma croceum F 1598]
MIPPSTWHSSAAICGIPPRLYLLFIPALITTSLSAHDTTLIATTRHSQVTLDGVLRALESQIYLTPYYIRRVGYSCQP